MDEDVWVDANGSAFLGSILISYCRVLIDMWLQQQGTFGAVLDGANVSLANTQHFSLLQQLQQMSPSKRLPLVILHTSQVTSGSGPAEKLNNNRLLEYWKKNNGLYATPQGSNSNDDWYWVYACVCCKSLLMINDDVRDHLFQLFGSSLFTRRKEKRQDIASKLATEAAEDVTQVTKLFQS